LHHTDLVDLYVDTAEQVQVEIMIEEGADVAVKNFPLAAAKGKCKTYWRISAEV
jgi:hypothetical protein